jgi:hypothetical protein
MARCGEVQRAPRGTLSSLSPRRGEVYMQLLAKEAEGEPSYTASRIARFTRFSIMGILN